MKVSTSSYESLLDAYRSMERTRLARLPTPLVSADRLARAAGAPQVTLLVKLDSETGFALGGNKVRKLEYALAPSRLRGVTRIVTAGGPQSNHCRVTAAAAARLGLACSLVVNGSAASRVSGNALLHRLFGAEIVPAPSREERPAALRSLARQLRRAGERPLIVPVGASDGIGAVGYVRAMEELAGQLGMPVRQAGPDESASHAGKKGWTAVVSSSSGGTLAGMVVGRRLFDMPIRLVGVSADATSADLAASVTEIAEETVWRLAGTPFPGGSEAGRDSKLGFAGSFLVDDGHVGEGYGIPTEASEEAVKLFARTEGIVLDPTYTGKAAAGLVHWLRTGRFRAGDRIVFVHTGGHPALLA